MKKTYLLLFCKHENKKGIVDGLQIRKNDKKITLHKDDIRELVMYLKMHSNLWLR